MEDIATPMIVWRYNATRGENYNFRFGPFGEQTKMGDQKLILKGLYGRHGDLRASPS